MEATGIRKVNRSQTSYIEDQEELQAKEYIQTQLGFNPIATINNQIAVKIYLRPEEISTVQTDDGRTISIYMPPTINAADRFRSCVALVISIGEECYRDEKYSESGPYCKVGDWIMIPRNVGLQVNFRGVPVQLVPEDAVYCVISDPTHIEWKDRRNYAV